jgi:hypothetical protein
MWLVPTAADKAEAPSVHLIFSELAITPEANLFQLVEKVPVKQLVDGKLTDRLETTKTDDGFPGETRGRRRLAACSSPRKSSASAPRENKPSS